MYTMKIITIGKLRYLYGLSCEIAHGLAEVLGAVYNSEVLPMYKGKQYKKEQFDKIISDLDHKGNGLPQKPKLISHKPDGSKTATSFSDDGLFYWAVGSSEIISLMAEGYKESLGKEYTRHPTDELSKLLYYNRAIILEALNLALLDTAVVDSGRAFRWIKDEGYAPQPRQVFDRYPDLNFSWKDFQSMLRLSHGVSLSQGGSTPETDKINATRVASENIQNDYIAQQGNSIQAIPLGITDFCEMVKIAMINKNQANLYQPSAAKRFFKESPELAPHKRKKGRPFKADE